MASLATATFLLLPAAPVGAAVAPGRGLTATAADAEAVPGELLVQYSTGVSRAERAQARARLGYTKLWDVPAGDTELVLTNDDIARPAEQAARARRDGAVRHAQPNYIWRPAATTPTPNDPQFDQLWGLQAIDAPDAWAVAPPPDGDVVVAVIDSGIWTDHPDLRANIWTNGAEVPDNCIDDDRNGVVDDVEGWDFYNNDASLFDSATNDAHGTHVAGTIAAVVDNGVAVAGVSQAKVMPIKFLGEDGGDSASAIAAIDYALANGADVINASWGGKAADALLAAKIAEAGAAGVLFITAAGNTTGNLDVGPQYPAAYAASMANVVTVAATDAGDGLASFSNYGARSVTLGAPGQAIVSTVPGASPTDAATASYSGTSMAAPHVAAAAAVVIGAYPDATILEVKERLVERGDPLPTLAATTISGRRLNLLGALGPDTTVVDTTVVVAPQPVLEPEPTPEPEPAPTPAPTTTTEPEPEPAPSPKPKPVPSLKPAPAPVRSGYWMLDAAGAVYGFGAAGHYGNATLPHRAADVEPLPSGTGYWVVDERGYVASFGGARHYGGVDGALRAGEVVRAMSATPRGTGYWLFTNLGRVIPFGAAAFHGDMAATTLNGPVLDSVATPSGRGYYMVGSDGGIFAFGDAAFHGSMGGRSLNAPVQSLVPDADGRGYWLVASDGGIFAFDAGFFGSMGGAALNRPISGMVASGSAGYLMVGSDGGIFAFGTAPFHGSLGATPPAHPIVAVAVRT